MFKNTKFYITYIIMILCYIIGSSIILSKMKFYAEKTYNPFISVTISLVSSVLLGILLGLEYLFKEKSKDGKWKINGAKFIILGLPCLLVLLWGWGPILIMQLFSMSNIKIIERPFLINTLFNNNTSIIFLAILVGWVLTTSFYKEN